MKDKRFIRIYRKLYAKFGQQRWWPAKTRLEVIIGAVLTQNTAWPNVEKAIANLKRHGLLSFKKMYKLKTAQLASLIRPAGYFNIKSRRLKNVLEFIQKKYGGNLNKMQKQGKPELRKQLLGINGVGPETADSIILYAFDKPAFVIDAYTKRVFSRLNMCPPQCSYDDLQKLFTDNLKLSTRQFNEYHALIVRLGKDYCKKSKPRCGECPIRDEH